MKSILLPPHTELVLYKELDFGGDKLELINDDSDGAICEDVVQTKKDGSLKKFSFNSSRFMRLLDPDLSRPDENEGEGLRDNEEDNPFIYHDDL